MVNKSKKIEIPKFSELSKEEQNYRVPLTRKEKEMKRKAPPGWKFFKEKGKSTDTYFQPSILMYFHIFEKTKKYIN
jgi:hypothetical protein